MTMQIDWELLMWLGFALAALSLFPLLMWFTHLHFKAKAKGRELAFQRGLERLSELPDLVFTLPVGEGPPAKSVMTQTADSVTIRPVEGEVG